MVLSVEGLPMIEGFLSLPDSSISNSSTDSAQYLSQCSSWTTKWCVLLNGALHVYANRVYATEMNLPRALNIIPLTTYQQLKVSGDYENSEWDLILSGTLPKINIATPTPSGSMDNCALPSTSKTLPRSATSGSLSAMFLRFGSGSSPSSSSSKSPRPDQHIRPQTPSEDTLHTSTTSPSSCRPVSRGSSITSFAPSSFNRHASLFNTTGSRNGSRRNSGSNGTLSPVLHSNDEVPEKRTWGKLSSRSKKLYNFVTSGLPSSSSNLAAELRRENGYHQQTLSHSPNSPCSPTSQFWSRSSTQSFTSSRSPSIAQQEDNAQILTLRAPDATSMVRWAEAISTSLNNDAPVIPKDPSLSQSTKPSISRLKRTPLTEVTEGASTTVRPAYRGRRSLSSGSIFAIMAPPSNQEVETLNDRKDFTGARTDFSVRAARSSADLLSSRENSSSSPTSYSFARQASSSPSEPRYSSSTNTTMASPPMVERILPPEEIIATIDRLRSERANNTQGLGLTGIQVDSYHGSISRSEQKVSKTSKLAIGHLSSKQSRPSTSPTYSDAGFAPPSFISTSRISEDQQSFASNRGTNMEAASAAAIAIISKQTADSEIGSPQLLRENIAESPSMVSRSLPVPPRKSRSFLALDQKRENDSSRIMRTYSPKKEMRIKTELANEQFSLPPSSSDLLRKSGGLDSSSSSTNINAALRENHESSNNTPKNNTNKKSYNLAKSAKMQKRISRSLELGNEDFITRSTNNKENMAVII